MHGESLCDFLKCFNKVRLQNKEYSSDIVLAALVNGGRHTHLRLSIRKYKPASLDELFEQIDKFVSQEESEMSLKTTSLV